MMKRIFLIIAFSLLVKIIYSQVPDAFTYQAVVRNGSGEPITSQNIACRFSVLKGNITGTEVYSEKHATSTNQFGLISLTIGNGTDKTGDLSIIDWGIDKYFLKTEVDATGGTNFIELGTSQILSVPYSFYSKTSLDAVKITGDQTITGNKVFSGTVSLPLPVNPNEAANKQYVDNQLNLIKGVLTNTNVIDADGNIYKISTIGTQQWLDENLKTTKLNNGTPIINATDNTTWLQADARYCWYANEITNKNTFGAIYNWNAIASNKLCPIGWHVPTDAEWTILENYLIANGYNYDGTTTENKIAKSLSAITGWKLSTTIGSVGNNDYPEKRNITGFSAQPAGLRNSSGNYLGMTLESCWWSSTYDAKYGVFIRRLSYSGVNSQRNFQPNNYYGYSVRCIKD